MIRGIEPHVRIANSLRSGFGINLIPGLHRTLAESKI
jgi:hypothetical protein